MAEVELPDVEELREKRENIFTKKVALFTAFYAVILAICSLGGNNSTKDMLLAQQQASNQWAFYQSKVMREHLYRIEKDRIESQLIERKASMRPEAVEHYQAMQTKAATEEVRYATEKRDIEQEAKKLDIERDINRAKDPYFDYGEVMLQIAIVMSSISIISLSRPVFFFSIAASAIGIILTLNGYFMIFRLPFL